MRREVPVSRLRGLLEGSEGLSAIKVADSRSAFGRNVIVAATVSGWLEVIRSTLQDPMVWFLAITAVLFVWLGDYAEASILASALIPIAGMDAYLHRRTQASTAGLASRLATQARVVRDGRETEVPAEDLVPGDLVLVPAGTYFPADGLIVAGESLQADESTLTGEALPVRKVPFAGLLAGMDSVAVDGEHWGMAGTQLLTGAARLRIVWTGPHTLYGEITELAQAVHAERTPLQDAIGQLVKVLVVIALAL